jgi:hypothetical protein
VRLSLDAFRLLHPDTPQDLDRRHMSEPVQFGCVVNSMKQSISIGADRFDQGRALGLLFGKPIFLNAMLIALIPLVWSKGA